MPHIGRGEHDNCPVILKQPVVATKDRRKIISAISASRISRNNLYVLIGLKTCVRGLVKLSSETDLVESKATYSNTPPPFSKTCT